MTTVLIKSKIFMYFHVKKCDVPVNQDTAYACTKLQNKYKDFFFLFYVGFRTYA